MIEYFLGFGSFSTEIQFHTKIMDGSRRTNMYDPTTSWRLEMPRRPKHGGQNERIRDYLVGSGNSSEIILNASSRDRKGYEILVLLI